ncbi:MAG: hypothetical protein ACOYIK_03300 [Coriobacteriales bacterium]|jgi:hypothetical protein
MKRFFAALLALTLVLGSGVLVACSAGESTDSSDSTDSSEPATSSESTDPSESTTSSDSTDPSESTASENSAAETSTEDQSLANLRAKTKESGSICAVIDLGYCPDQNPSGLDSYSSSGRQVEAFPFIGEIPEDRIIDSNNGTNNAFCIVPADENSTIEIYEYSLGESGELERGDLIYKSDDGSPIILLCMVGDIYTSARVTVNDPSGATIESYGPFYSGKDGSLIIEDDNGNKLYDATVI